MTVLMKVDPKELAARKKTAEYNFRNRVSGLDLYAGMDPDTQRSIAAFVKGGVEEVFCHNALELIPNYLAKVAEGFSLNKDYGTMNKGPIAFILHMNRPEADIKSDLAIVLEKVKAEYENEIAKYNDDVLEREINFQVQREIRAEQKQQAEQEQARRDRIAGEVKATYGAAK